MNSTSNFSRGNTRQPDKYGDIIAHFFDVLHCRQTSHDDKRLLFEVFKYQIGNMAILQESQGVALGSLVQVYFYMYRQLYTHQRDPDMTPSTLDEAWELIGIQLEVWLQKHDLTHVPTKLESRIGGRPVSGNSDRIYLVVDWVLAGISRILDALSGQNRKPVAGDPVHNQK